MNELIGRQPMDRGQSTSLIETMELSYQRGLALTLAGSILQPMSCSQVATRGDEDIAARRYGCTARYNRSRPTDG